MSYEVCRYIFIGGLVLSLVMLAAAVVLFFVLDIRKVIGEFNGSTRRKAIEKIRKRSTGEAPITGKVSRPKPPETKRDAEITASTTETSKIRPQDRYDSMSAETTALNAEPISETTVLNAVEEPSEPRTAPVMPESTEHSAAVYQGFSVDIDITYVHSNEIIK